LKIIYAAETVSDFASAKSVAKLGGFMLEV
jgi:hypothetical protein